MMKKSQISVDVCLEVRFYSMSASSGCGRPCVVGRDFFI